jgi:DNA-binding NarL/FixJ family response regulator
LNNLQDKIIKILIAEDDELSNESFGLLISALLNKDHEIHSLYSGEKVVEEIEKNGYDLVFLDNKLPGKNGLNILRELKKRNINSNIVFLTGFSDEEIIEEAESLGIISYVNKGSLDTSQISDILNRLFQS